MPTKLNINQEMKNDPFYRYKMTEVEIKHEGQGNGQRTIFVNVDEIANDIERTPSMIVSYLSTVHGCSCKIDKDKRYVFTGTYQKETFQSSIYNFIELFVLCKNCKNPETQFEKKGKHDLCLRCKACPETSDIVVNKNTQKVLRQVKL